MLLSHFRKGAKKFTYDYVFQGGDFAWSYDVSFVDMTQTNVHTDKVRSIRRLVVFHNEADV